MFLFVFLLGLFTEVYVARALDTWLARSCVFQLGVLEFSGLLATPVERTEIIC